ncbi:MAG TPA: EAL domain-containing protein [Bryobacteraceae bacterium]|nr:EAL domain-containing protein [Bryobacteraceae bacterium]
MNAPYRTLLVVDDEPNHVELLRRAFANKAPPTELLHASTLKEAENLMAESGERIKLILADRRLPDGDGTDLLASGRAPVIVFTAHGNQEFAVHALKKGALDYVVKSDATLLEMPLIVETALARWNDQWAREAMAQALRNSEERYSLAVMGSNDGIWDWDIQAGLFFVSARWREMFSYAGSAFPDSIDDWLSLVHPQDLAGFRTCLSSHLRSETSHFEREHRLKAGDGIYRWVLMRGLAVRNEEGTPHRMAGSLTEITERKRIEQQLEYSAFHDSLTGLYNRAIFVQRLHHRMGAWQQGTGDTFAVLFLDFDRFKFINDNMGHSAGDAFLRVMAERLRKHLREADTLARFGGDEFTILLDSVESQTEAVALAGRIHQELRAPFVLREQAIYPSVSIGLAVSGEQYSRAEDILRCADYAMYQAKALGGMRLAVSDEEAFSSSRSKLKLEHDLRRALAQNEFTLAYQPIVRLPARKIVAWECLLRWIHPGRGWMPAAEFIPLAEYIGVIPELDELALTMAARQQRHWRSGLGRSVRLTVNLSAAFFGKPGFMDIIEETVRTSGSGEPWLDLELTEGSLIQQLSIIERELPRLQSLGIGLWLDDFGTGYSSLNYLAHLPLHRLKIDRSFTAHMIDSPKDMLVVKAILSLAGSLGVPVVGEGIESALQVEKLIELKCPYGQGNYLSVPVDGEAVTETLAYLHGSLPMQVEPPICKPSLPDSRLRGDP